MKRKSKNHKKFNLLNISSKKSVFVFVLILMLFLIVILSLLYFQKPVLRYVEVEGLHGRKMSDLLDVDDLIFEMKTKNYVLLGESTHGTDEYYLIRKHITQELIKNHGFNFVVLEGDWASIYELNKYVKNLEGAKETAREAMQGLDRWPEWMWKNNHILELIDWLRDYNDELSEDEKVGIYGMDVYSPLRSYEKLKYFLNKNNIELQTMQELDLCLEGFGYNFDNYPSYYAQTRISCEEEIKNTKQELLELELSSKEEFIIEQMISVVKNAEKHYRNMVFQSYASWNYRVSHFADTMIRLSNYYGVGSKGIAWAHNTHVGDSNFVEGAQGMLNIGRLLREKNKNTFLLGFVKNEGRVSAGNAWGSNKQIMNVPEARPNSYGALFAEHGLEKALFIFEENHSTPTRNHRAIGVVYNPFQEQGNYVPTIITKRYDAVIFIKETNELLKLK